MATVVAVVGAEEEVADMVAAEVGEVEAATEVEVATVAVAVATITTITAVVTLNMCPRSKSTPWSTST